MRCERSTPDTTSLSNYRLIRGPLVAGTSLHVGSRTAQRGAVGSMPWITTARGDGSALFEFPLDCEERLVQRLELVEQVFLARCRATWTGGFLGEGVDLLSELMHPALRVRQVCSLLPALDPYRVAGGISIGNPPNGGSHSLSHWQSILEVIYPFRTMLSGSDLLAKAKEMGDPAKVTWCVPVGRYPA
jgi:hypothetical protein